MTTAVIENLTRPLIKTDICDRCRASAMIVARSETNSDRELHFCNHHGAMYRDNLIAQGFYMDVETVEGR